MNIAIPIEQDQGLDSPICGHFGSAPLFAIVDTDSGAVRVKQNQNQEHAHGQCRPLRALDGETVERVVVGGIGPGALFKLEKANIEVYRAQGATVSETLAALEAGQLARVTADSACNHGHGHGHGHGGGGGGGCGHGQGHGHGHGGGGGCGHGHGHGHGGGGHGKR